jgi:dinuclear metal center YbgI/SA1388 family protein
MLVSDLAAALNSIAPLSVAESWDNTGLLIGAADQRLSGPTLLSIDLTERVAAEAVALKASAVVAYHPPLWDPIKRITTETPRGRILLRCIEHKIAVYSPHTALDAATGGVTDWLCEGLSGGSEGKIHGDCRALAPHQHADPNQEVKIVTFVPESQLEEVRNALASAGAGIIGAYKVCSFASPGVGTFLGDDTTIPTVGKAGRLERIAELRLEMVCARHSLPIAVETLERFHPYEEPAIDVYALLPRPDRHAGAGRRLTLDQPVALATLAERLKQHLGISVVNIAAATDHDPPLSRIGVCPGSGASLIAAAREDTCQAFVTGEMKHHEVLAALDAGLSLILAGHTNTERGYLPRLARRLGEALPAGKFVVSQSDRSPRVPV